MRLLAFLPDAGSTHTWQIVACVAHVTLFALAGVVVYRLLARRGPAAAAWSATTVLVGIALITLLSLVPRPAFWRIGLPTELQVTRAFSFSGESGQKGITPQPLPATVRPAAGEIGQERPALLGDSPAVATPPAARREAGGRDRAWTVRTWPWIAWGAAALCLGMSWMTLRLAAGLWTIRRCRRRAQRIDDPDLAQLAGDIAAQLGLAESFQLAVSTEIGSPATVGWRRPLILLPVDWRSWTFDERRAVLAHELAHIYRRDYLAWVAALAVRSLHFYHPVIHWLVGRLRLQQELAADALAMPLAGGRHSYLMTLARMTLDYDRRLAGPARAFLPSPGTLFRRIEMLSNDSLDRADRRNFSRRARRLTIALLSASALVIVAFRGPELERASAEPPPQPRFQINTWQYPLEGIASEVQSAVAMRPGELFDKPELFQVWLKQTPLRLVAALKAEQVVGLVVAQSIAADRPRNPTQLLGGFDQGVIVLKEPADWTALLEASGAKPVAKRLEDEKVVYEFGSAPELVAYAPSKTRLYVGQKSQRHLEQLITAGPDKLPAAWKDAVQAAAAKPLVAAVPGTTLRQLKGTVGTATLQSQPPGGAAGDASRNTGFLISQDPAELAVQSLAVELEMVVLTTRKPGERGLEATFTYRDAKGAQQALAAATPLVQQTRDVLGNVLAQTAEASKRLPESQRVEFQKSQKMLATLHQLVTSYQATQAGAQIKVTTDVELAQVVEIGDAAGAAQAAATRQRSMNNFKQVMLAWHNYHDVHGGLPAASIESADGKPLLSWRVAILPLIGQNDLYKEFHLNEPWDSDHNKKLLEKMPNLYRSPAIDAATKTTNTSVVAIVGAEAALDPTRQRKFSQVTDGTSNTIAIVETKTDIPWTKPEDLEFDSSMALPKISGYHTGGGPDGGFIAGFCDGHVRFVAASLDAEMLKKLFTINGGESVELP